MTRIFMLLLGNQHTASRRWGGRVWRGVKIGPQPPKRRGEAENVHVRKEGELGAKSGGGGRWPWTCTERQGAARGVPQVRNRRDDPVDADAAGRRERRAGGAGRARHAGVTRGAAARHHRGRDAEAEGRAREDRRLSRQERGAREAAR